MRVCKVRTGGVKLEDSSKYKVKLRHKGIRA